MHPSQQTPLARPTDFRFRSAEIARIEGLSDGVFAFAVTLLIVSLEGPRTYGELISAMRGFFAFAICFALLVSQMIGISQPAVTPPSGRVEAVLEEWQAPQLMIIFGAGFVAVSVVFVLMYWHTWRQRDRLGLHDLERLDTRESIGGAIVNIAVALLSILFASIGGPGWTTAAGMTYPIGSTPTLTTFHGVRGRRGRKLEERHLAVSA